MLEEYEEDRLNSALAILSEHFPNYAVAILSEDDGNLHYDYSNWRIARMLFADSLTDMCECFEASNEAIVWEEEEEDYE
jgi:hypothetical protein